MGLKQDLDVIYEATDKLPEILDSCNTALASKGVDTAAVLSEVPDRIGEIESAGVDFIRYANSIKFNNINFGVPTVTLNLDRITILGLLGTAVDVENTSTEHIIINCPNQVTNCYMMFYSSGKVDRKLNRITMNVDTSKATRFSSAFSYLAKLEVIDGEPLDFSSATEINNMFISSTNIKEFRVAPNSIKVSCGMNHPTDLSDDTINSIIDGLTDLTGSTAKNLDLHANVIDKLTSDQLSQIQAKNWNII